MFIFKTLYGKCLKILNIKWSDKMAYANGVDQDQTAPSGVVWSGSTLFVIYWKYFKKQHKKQNLGQKSMEWSVSNFRIFTVIAADYSLLIFIF